MPGVLFLSALIAFFPAHAAAFTNCDTINAVSRIEERFQCIQKNQAELQAQLEALKAGLIRYGEALSVVNPQDPELCLRSGTGAAFEPCNRNQGQQRVLLRKWE